MVIHILLLALTTVYCKDVVSAERENVHKMEKDKHLVNTDNGRRFHEDMDDKEWHISHLKDTNFFHRSSGCSSDTYEDRVNKYRRMLKSDAALVEFVQAEPLPFNESDLIETCAAPKNIADLFTKEATKKSSTNVTGIKTTTQKEELKSPVTAQVDSATTVSPKTTQAISEEEENITPKIRRSEYLFSSVEYYDELIDFDDEKCPDAVEVIHLEIDLLRNYDVECEATIEWRSLE